MADFSYIDTTGAAKTFQAADQTAAQGVFATVKDADPHSGFRMLPGPAPAAPAAPATIPNPAPAPAPGYSSVQPPTLPAPTAPAANTTLLTGMSANLDSMRTALESTYKTNQTDIQSQIDAANAKITDYTSKQTDALQNVDTLTAPFRADLEAKQEALLHVNENFEANQKLVGELEQLLNDGNAAIKAQQQEGGLDTIASANLSKTVSDINARAGVIKAVMDARNGQISTAFTMIDRTAAAISADRTDKLGYYKTLLDFYQNQKDEEGKKIITLDAEKSKFLDAQIGLLEGDMKTAQDSVDYIKKLMLDPQTALTIAQSGVTLNDTPEQVNSKLADYAYTQDRSTRINNLTEKGYSFMSTPQQAAMHPASELFTIKDAKGNDMTFWKDPSKQTTLTSEQQDLAVLNQAVQSAIAADQASGANKDGYLSPDDYASAKQSWLLRHPGMGKQFDDAFSSYRNPNDTGYNTTL